MYIFYSSELPGHLVTNNSKQLVMNNSQQLVTDSSEQPLLADFLVKSSEVGNWWNYHSILMCVSPSWMKAFCETCKDAVIYALVNQRRIKGGTWPDLQGCAGEQETVGCNVVGVEDLRELAVMVLHAVALVDDHVLPTQLQNNKHQLQQLQKQDSNC